MKKFLTLICMGIIPFFALAQNTFPSAGNAGIGTLNPNLPLTLVTSGAEMAGFTNTTAANTRIYVANTTGQMNIGIGSATPHAYLWSNTGSFFIGNDGAPTLFVSGMGNGNVGIGTTAPWAPLSVLTGNTELAHFKGTSTSNSAISVSNATGQMNIGIGAATPHPYLWSNTGSFFIGNDGTPTLFVSGMGNGSVGIGTINPQAKLAVNGDIFAKGVKVTPDGWSDYVFYTSYRLRPLSEVEQYIQQHHHLPEVPTEEQVKKDGVDLGDNQATLLKKIEELTLYVIELNKKIEKLEKKAKTSKVTK